MSWHWIPEIGTVHFQDVKPPRVVPGHERHKWDCKPNWGESATCIKCGAKKLMLKTRPDWTTRYQLAGSDKQLTERPPCTGTPPLNLNAK